MNVRFSVNNAAFNREIVNSIKIKNNANDFEIRIKV